mgnify:CR=1 FL=1
MVKKATFCHSALDAESRSFVFSGFPPEFTPYLIRGGNDKLCRLTYERLSNTKTENYCKNTFIFVK